MFRLPWCGSSKASTMTDDNPEIRVLITGVAGSADKLNEIIYTVGARQDSKKPKKDSDWQHRKLKVICTSDIKDLCAGKVAVVNQRILKLKEKLDCLYSAILMTVLPDCSFSKEHFQSYELLKKLWDRDSFCKKLMIVYLPCSKRSSTITDDLQKVEADAHFSVLRTSPSKSWEQIKQQIENHLCTEFSRRLPLEPDSAKLPEDHHVKTPQTSVGVTSDNTGHGQQNRQARNTREQSLATQSENLGRITAATQTDISGPVKQIGKSERTCRDIGVGISSNDSTERRDDIAGNNSTERRVEIFRKDSTEKRAGTTGNYSAERRAGISGNDSNEKHAGISGPDPTKRRTGILGNDSTGRRVEISGQDSTGRPTGISGQGSAERRVGTSGNDTTERQMKISGQESTGRQGGNNNKNLGELRSGNLDTTVGNLQQVSCNAQTVVGTLHAHSKTIIHNVPNVNKTDGHTHVGISHEVNDTLSQAHGREIRIMIIGNTGKGKSTLGNVLLGQSCFKVARGMSSATKTAQTGEAPVDGFFLKVLDTPDIDIVSDAGSEVDKWKNLIGCDPDVILLAISCDVRYTPEEYIAYRRIKDLWGSKSMCKHLLVAFTFGDCLERQIDEELQTVSPEEKAVLRDAGNRYYVFDKTKSNSSRTPLQSILEIIKAHDVPFQCNTPCPSSRPAPATDCSILVVGKRRSGKTTLRNVLMNSHFHIHRPCTENVEVFEAPDISGVRDKRQEVKEWKRLTAPEPTAILLTVRSDVVYTSKDHNLFLEMQRLWGAEAFCRRLVVAFTFGDSQQIPIDQDSTRWTSELQALVKYAGNRAVIFDNSGRGMNKSPNSLQCLNQIITDMHASHNALSSTSSFPAQPVVQRRCILLIGNLRSGKSTLGNKLLDGQYFATDNCNSAEAKSADGSTKVIDTPGIVKDAYGNRNVMQEIEKWRHAMPDAILWVVPCGIYYTRMAHSSYTLIKQMWGADSFCRHLVVAFTFGDRQHIPIEGDPLLDTQELRQVLQDASGHFVIFDNSDNKAANRFPHAVQALFQVIAIIKSGR